MTTRTNKRKDFNEIAFAIGQIATGETTPEPESEAAKAGRKGGLKGGDARAAALTPAKRKAIAQKAARARWGK
jgi:hypothetical protein